MDEIRILPIEASDESFLWEMLFQVLYVPEGIPPFSRSVLAEADIACYVKGWGRPGDWGLIAREGETLVGAI